VSATGSKLLRKLTACQFLLTLCATELLSAQVSLPNRLDRLNGKQRKTLDEYISKHETPTGEIRVHADRQRTWVLSSQVLQDAFPHCRFVKIRWSYSVDPHARRQYSIPSMISNTVVIDETGAVVGDLPSFGDQEQFGRFLISQKVRLTNYDDAVRLARIMTDLGLASYTFPNIRHSSTEWYLSYRENPFRPVSGEEETRESYYYDAQTSADGFVVGFKLRSEVLERRKIHPSTTSK
jgi:hypothetical protein